MIQFYRKETKFQKSKVTCLRSCSYYVVELKLLPSFVGLENIYLFTLGFLRDMKVVEGKAVFCQGE